MKDRFNVELEEGMLVLHIYNTSGRPGIKKGEITGFTKQMVKFTPEKQKGQWTVTPSNLVVL